MRILKWIVQRVRRGAEAVESCIGWVPRYEDIDWNGADYSPEQWDRAMEIDREAWKQQVLQHKELFQLLGEHLPEELLSEREALASRL